MEGLGKRQPAGGKRVKIKFGIKHQQWGYGIGRLFLGAVFIYAAILKIGSPQDFADSIAAYQILPVLIINLFALGLPFFELACGLLALTGFFLRIGVLGILAMLIMFIAALATSLLRGLDINCGCFGAHSWFDSNPWVALLHDTCLLILAILVYRYHLIKTEVTSRL
jgi:putative oxidoreductase